MRERRKDAPFLDKTLVDARKLQVRLKQFHRYMLIHIDALREPDRAHAALPSSFLG